MNYNPTTLYRQGIHTLKESCANIFQRYTLRNVSWMPKAGTAPQLRRSTQVQSPATRKTKTQPKADEKQPDKLSRSKKNEQACTAWFNSHMQDRIRAAGLATGQRHEKTEKPFTAMTRKYHFLIFKTATEL